MIETHPLIVHFPIGLLCAAGLFLIGFVTTKRPSYQTMFVHTFFLGVCGLLAAVLTGLSQEDSLLQNQAIHELLETHELLGYVALGVFAALLFWKLKRKAHMQRKELSFFACIYLVALAVMAFGAHLGGQMVYIHGAGVEPMKERIRAEGFVVPED